MLHLDSEGNRRLCCEAGPAPKETSNKSYKDFYLSPYMQEKRAQFLRGEYPKECRVCEVATHKITTFQKRLNELFAAQIPSIHAKTNADGTIKVDAFAQGGFAGSYLDYRKDTCNLSCATCGPEYSSSWKKKLLPLGKENPYPMSQGDENDLFAFELPEIAELPNLDIFYFAGGEPLLRNENIEVLRKLSRDGRAKDVRLIYNTNFSVREDLLKKYLLEWENFKEVWVFCSLDGVGTIGEKIRQGLRYSDFEKNFLELEERYRHSNVHFCIDFTVTSFMFYQLIDFSQFLLRHHGYYQGKFMVGREAQAGFMRVEYLTLTERKRLYSKWYEYFKKLPEESRKRLRAFQELIESHEQLGEFSELEKLRSKQAKEFFEMHFKVGFPIFPAPDSSGEIAIK